jgi:hypothetical protein
VRRLPSKRRVRHIDLLRDGLAQRRGGHVGDDHGPGLAALRVDEGQDRGLVGLALTALPGLVALLVLRLSTDPRFVRDHEPAHGLGKAVALHGLADAVHQVPCGAAADAVLALDLASGDPVLRGTHLEEAEHPHPHRHLRAVHTRPGDGGELLAARLEAAPHPPLRLRSRCGWRGSCRSSARCTSRPGGRNAGTPRCRPASGVLPRTCRRRTRRGAGRPTGSPSYPYTDYPQGV